MKNKNKNKCKCILNLTVRIHLSIVIIVYILVSLLLYEFEKREWEISCLLVYKKNILKLYYIKTPEIELLLLLICCEKFMLDSNCECFCAQLCPISLL